MTARDSLPVLKPHAHYDYERVIIQGRVIDTTPLRVASGFDHEEELTFDGEPAKRLVPVLCRDAADAPYVPASTLRGLLRASLDRHSSEHLRLFGTARLAEDPKRPPYQPARGVAGRLRVYDARWSANQDGGKAEYRQRIALDAVTRTAADNLFFVEVTLPAGCSFDWELELDRVDNEDLSALILALRAIGNGPGVGGGRALGQGRLQWQRDHELIEVIERESFQDWLRDDDLSKRPDHEDYIKEADLTDAASDPAPAHTHLDSRGNLQLALRLYAKSPVLASPERKPASDDGDSENNLLSFPRQGDRTSIPASSLKGMLRAQARRILLTCLEDGFAEADDGIRCKVADAMLAQLLGDTGCMSRLRLTPAETAFTEDEVHRQMMNAIDRFSGAVAEHKRTSNHKHEDKSAADAKFRDRAGALFGVQAVRPSAPYEANAELTAAALETSWMRGLLVLLLRDSMEGDLHIGWGRARGFGAVRLGLAVDGGVLKHWGELPDAINRLNIDANAPREWVQAYEDEFKTRMQRELGATA